MSKRVPYAFRGESERKITPNKPKISKGLIILFPLLASMALMFFVQKSAFALSAAEHVDAILFDKIREKGGVRPAEYG